MRAFPVVVVVVVALAACAPEEPKCSRELAALSNAHSDRQHGYTQSDDVKEAIKRLQDALACVDEQHVAQILPHARQLHARLAIRGNTDELASLAGILASAPHKALQDESARISDEVRRARAAREPLRAHAEKNGHDTERARLMGEAAGLATPAERAQDTTHFITHVSSWESCLVVLPGAALPKGTALAAIQRGTIALPLHGDPPAFPISERTARTIRLCSATAFAPGDVVRLTINGSKAWEATLAPDADDEARGAAILALGATGKVPAACASPTTLPARLACAWGKAAAP